MRHALFTCTILALFLLTFAPKAHAQDAPLAWTPADPDLEWGACPAFMPESCEIAVLQGAPDQPNADIFFKMAPGTAIPSHRHTSVERMVLVSGEMQVTYEGHDPVVLRPGTYAFGPAELPHEASCAVGEECILFIGFEEPIDAMPAEPVAADQ
jgi:quercetin dioxygenase-like cupin family protein